LKRILNNIVRIEERALLKRIQKKYNIIALMIAIQRQLNGKFSNNKNIIFESEIIQIKFIERYRIIEIVLNDLLIFADQKNFRRYINFSINIIALYKRRKRQRPKINNSRENSSIKIIEISIILSKSELKKTPNVPLKYKNLQYFFCLSLGDG
jgi:hypothetical protein